MSVISFDLPLKEVLHHYFIMFSLITCQIWERGTGEKVCVCVGGGGGGKRERGVKSKLRVGKRNRGINSRLKQLS